ncbi:MAG: DNA polymerase III subunit beta [Blastocatellia bacterium]
MHLTVAKQTLLKELNFIQGVVEKKNTIPILSNVLIELYGDELHIKGTDLDVSISAICDVNGKKNGAVCVPARKLFDIVKALPDAEVELKLGDNDQVHVTCERSRFKMPGLPRDNYPQIPEFKGAFVILPTDLLRSFIARTIFAATTEESRYALNGAKFELFGLDLRMVATDGHRLAFVEKKAALIAGGNEQKIDVIIPRKTLTELGKLCAETEESIEFGRDENHLFFKIGRRILVSRMLSGQFPNYELVLPKDNNNHIAIDSERIAGAVRRVALMADERSHAIRFTAGKGQISISSQANDVGEAGETLPVEYEGPDIAAGFNAQYLAEFFSVVQDGTIIFDFKDGSTQTQMRPGGDGGFDYRYIVMPLRI